MKRYFYRCGTADARELRSGALYRTVALVSLLAALLVTAYFLPAFTDAGRADTAYDSEELQFLELVNDYRAENGVGALILSDDLTVAAERHSEDMGRYGFFAHDTVQSSYYAAGSEPWDRMAAEGYDYNAYKGENLAAGYETAEAAFEAWKDSPSHNAAMLDGKYRVMGVARLDVPGSPFGWYWTTDFGSFVDDSARTGNPDGSTGSDGEPRKDAGNAVENGGFAGKGSWQQGSKDGAKLILRGEFVRMGGYADGRDILRQKVEVPAGATLRYDLRVSSAGKGDRDDVMNVRLVDGKGKTVAVLKRTDGTKESDWKKRGVDLTRYAGRDLYITFVARTDDRDDTYFYLDNVSVTGQTVTDRAANSQTTSRN